MKKSILILALLMPLSAQEEKKSEPLKCSQCEPLKEVVHKRKQMQKKQKIKSMVRLAVVAGIAYYVGYHEGEKHSKPIGRRFPMGDKK